MSTCCKAVIFDLDGTLLDTLADLADSMNYTLKKYGFPEKELIHHRNAIGNGIRNYAEKVLPKDKVSDELLDRFVPDAAQQYRNNSMVKTVVFDGIFELLDFLTEENIAMNILSNKRDAFVKELTEHYFSDYNFICINGELPNIAKKPHPDAALNIAKSCNIKPEEILFIGDSFYDIQTGKNAKMKTIAVTWGFQDENVLSKESPDFMAHTPEDIIEYIKSLY